MISGLTKYKTKDGPTIEVDAIQYFSILSLDFSGETFSSGDWNSVNTGRPDLGHPVHFSYDGCWIVKDPSGLCRFYEDSFFNYSFEAV